jgi:CheY-like chemotaxis protein
MAMEPIQIVEDDAIIIFTAFSPSLHRQKCLAAGADYFFDKTTDLKEFQATLKSIAKQKLTAKPG